MAETDVGRLDFDLNKYTLGVISRFLPTPGTGDTDYPVDLVEAEPLDSTQIMWSFISPRWLLQIFTKLVRQMSSLEERIAMLEEQTRWTDTGIVPSSPIPVIQTTRERLWAMGQEGRSRALEYDGDPIEDLGRILPEDLSAEEWQNILSGAYD